MTKDALLEIGSEELPASFIGPGMRQLKALAEESLKASELSFDSVDVFGTPRRLAVVICGLAEHSPDQKKVVSGPPAGSAKDAQGQWTPAALGFARKQGLKPSDLTVDNDRLTATLHIKGVATRRLLSDLYPQWISKLEFPKTMAWEPTRFRYARPIRWVTALYGTDLVPLSVCGVRSTRWTLGAGPWAPKKVPVSSAGKYAMILKNQCVLVDPAERRQVIRRIAEQAVKRVGKVILTEVLLEEVANLIEHPVAIVGNFDPAYLQLPKEVLITCLVHHQKFFPVETSDGKLLPQFVGIRNGISVHQEIVKEGYERVLSARLADARFFFNQDRKTPLAAKAEALRGVAFQAKLGSLFDKKERVKRLLDVFAPPAPDSGGFEKAKRVADLCKADLVTAMVGEFPELQGIMARLYAQADGEEAPVVQALEEHYWPITLSSPLPSSDIGARVALADKLDTLAGDFGVGLIPTGSADPYGLRRAAVGVLRILEDRKWPLTIEFLVSEAMNNQPVSDEEKAQAVGRLAEFLRQRFVAWAAERGFQPAVIAAILKTPQGFVSDDLDRMGRFQRVCQEPVFTALFESAKRVANIIKQAREKGRHPQDYAMLVERFTAEEEKRLWDCVVAFDRAYPQQGLDGTGYEAALRGLASFRDHLAEFFLKVMVFVDGDENLLQNRLALLFAINERFSRFADFSKLQNA
jgi:glycyl-tRNA synthetase beta chain